MLKKGDHWSIQPREPLRPKIYIYLFGLIYRFAGATGDDRTQYMIVGIDARPLSAQMTGIGYFLSNLLDALQKKDHWNNYILVSNGKIDFRMYNPLWEKFEGGVKNRLGGMIWMQLCLSKMAHKKRLDLFWGTRHQLPLFLPKHVRTILTVYDIVHKRFPHTMAVGGLLTEKALMGPSLKRADAIMTISNFTKNEIIRQYGTGRSKIHTVYPGVPGFAPPPDGRRNSISLPERYFLFVGTMEPRKNLVRLLEAFQDKRLNQEDIALIIAGSKGWKNNHFYRLLKQHGMANRVTLYNYIDRSQLKELYEHAVALLMPSLYEGFGFPILEAMANETPVITADRASMAEIGGGASLMVNPYSRKEIADAMVRLLHDQTLRTQLIKRGLDKQDRFRWDKAADEMIHLFEKVYKN